MLNAWARTMPKATRPQSKTSSSTARAVATTAAGRPARDSTKVGVDNANY